MEGVTTDESGRERVTDSGISYLWASGVVILILAVSVVRTERVKERDWKSSPYGLADEPSDKRVAVNLVEVKSHAGSCRLKGEEK
jgi:hypothetical protein